MNREYVDTHNVIERYLLGTLTDTERADFETLYFEDPSLLEALDNAEALLRGVRQVAAQGAAGASKAVVTTAPIPRAVVAPVTELTRGTAPPDAPTRATPVRPSRRAWLGASLGLNGALAAGLLLALNLASTPPSAIDSDGFVNADLIEFSVLRGSDVKSVVFSATDDWLTLSIPTDRQPGPFDLTVRTDERELMRQSTIELPRGRRRLEWTVPGTRLGPGHYELLVSSANGEMRRWPFSVTPTVE